MVGPKTDRNGQIQPQSKSNAMHLDTLIHRYKDQIRMALPKHITPDRMARIAITALRTTKDLDKCSPASFMACVYQCAQLGLEPNTPLQQAFLIPRRSSKTNSLECTLQIGYQGYMDMSRRSGMVYGIKGHVVRIGDEFDYEEGLDPVLRHKPSTDPDRESKAVTHAYAVARMKDGPPEFVVLSKAQIDVRMRRNESVKKGQFSAWMSDYDAMAMKTAVRALWKWLPKSSEIARAEAIEVASETHGDQSEAWDPSVNDALASGGLLPEDTGTDEEADDAKTAD